MTNNHKTLEIRIDEYVKYCVSIEFIEEYIYETENLEIPKSVIFNEIYFKHIKGAQEIIKERSDAAFNCQSMVQQVQYDILQEAIFSHYKNDQSTYEGFLDSQFEQASLDQDENANRLDILLHMYYHLPYPKSFIFKALDHFISKRSMIESYRYIVMLGFFVEVITQDKHIDLLTTQQNLRKIAYQVPNKEDYKPNHTRYLSDAVGDLAPNMVENQLVYEFWLNNEQFPDIAELAKSRLKK